MQEHELTETTTQKGSLNIDNDELVVSNVEVDTCLECSCGKEFESDEEAIDHIELETHSAVQRIKRDTDRFDIVNTETRGPSIQIDLDHAYDNFTGKVGLSVMKAIHNTGYFVSGVHTGAPECDARIWVREQ